MKLVYQVHVVLKLTERRLGGTKAYELQISADKKSVVDNHCCHTATKFAVSIEEDQNVGKK